MTPIRRFTIFSVLLIAAAIGVALWLTSSAWYPAATAKQRNLARLRRELGGYRTFQASALELRAFGDRLVLMLENDRESAEFLIVEYVAMLASTTWLKNEECDALRTEFARRCLRTYLSEGAWDGNESERVIRPLVSLLPRSPNKHPNWSDERKADLVMLLELWKRNRSVIDDTFDPNNMFNQGLVSVRPPMNGVRYLEPQHIVPDAIRAHKDQRQYEQQSAENHRIHRRTSQQTNARRLDEALRQGIVQFVKYAFENPPDEIDDVWTQFKKYDFEIMDPPDFLSGFRSRYQQSQDLQREHSP